jgi:hypothetical protein
MPPEEVFQRWWVQKTCRAQAGGRQQSVRLSFARIASVATARPQSSRLVDDVFFGERRHFGQLFSYWFDVNESG